MGSALDQIVSQVKKAESEEDLYAAWLEEYNGGAKSSSDSETDPEEDFLSEELLIAATIGIAVAANADKVIKPILAEVATESMSRLDDVLLEANEIMSDSFDSKVEATVSASIMREMNKGANLTTGGFAAIAEMNSVTEMHAGMIRSSKYYTNNYFNRFVMPDLHRSISNFLEHGLDPDTVYKSIQARLYSRLKSVPYWRMVANVAASRSYHYGLTKAGAASGHTSYRLIVIHDDVTSTICKSLSNKVFWLADANNLMERVAAAEDVEEVKTLMPWARAKDIEGFTNDNLVDAGIMMPPFHGHCRTTIELL